MKKLIAGSTLILLATVICVVFTESCESKTNKRTETTIDMVVDSLLFGGPLNEAYNYDFYVKNRRGEMLESLIEHLDDTTKISMLNHGQNSRNSTVKFSDVYVGVRSFCLIHSLIIYENPSKEMGSPICRTCILNKPGIDEKVMDYQYLQLVKEKLLKWQLESKGMSFDKKRDLWLTDFYKKLDVEW